MAEELRKLKWNIGDIVGNYKIIDIDGKNSNGNQLYKVKCLTCGFERVTTVRSINQTPNLDGKCNHFVMNCRWKSRRLFGIYKKNGKKVL